MKVFISHPISGKNTEEILKDRNEASKRIKEKFDSVEIIDSFIDSHFAAPPLYYLGKAIEKMATADLVYFIKGWKAARGCQIEHICALLYGIPIYDEDKENEL